MCFNSLTVNGFVKDQNSVENINASIGQVNGADEERALFRKRGSMDDRRESVLLDNKVVFLSFFI
jgi:hypothetical protein